ncbi:MAG: hypothetical protein JNM07_05330 [Phycisphaerae bacterium]|nr:hypothetical protein [Phycisphaerae bacterium]
MVRTMTSGVRLWLARTAIVLGVVLGAALPSTTARAQFAMGMGAMMGDDPKAPITRRSVQRYAETLKLDPDQRDAALTLHEGYLANFKANAKQMQKAYQVLSEKAQENNDWASYGKQASKLAKEYMEKFESNQKGFIEDIRTLLTDEQASRWADFERLRRREDLLRFAIVSGQGVDLVEATRTLGLTGKDSPAGLAEAVASYEMDMDRTLTDAERLGKEMMSKMYDAEAMQANPQEMEKLMKQVMDRARAMRDINRKHARLMTPLLNPEQASKFDAEFKRRSFPRVYRKPHVVKTLDAASGMADLDAGQKDTLKSVREAYERDAAGLNERWAAAIEEIEAKSENMWESFWGGDRDPKSPLAQARKARRDLDKSTMDRVAGVLKEEQRKRLPEETPEPQNPWAQMMGGDEEDGGN